MATIKKKKKSRDVRDDLRNRWLNMHYRCYKENHQSYKSYGGRGIRVCQEWHEFEPFYEWSLNNGFSQSLRIGRIDFNGNYGPDNCKYMTITEQANNRRSNRFETYRGVTDTLINLIRRFKKKENTVKSRLAHGFSFIEAMDGRPRKRRRVASAEVVPPKRVKQEKVKQKKRKLVKIKKIVTLTQISYNGKTMSVRKWCKETGIPKATLIYRLSHWGKDYDRCFNEPLRQMPKSDLTGMRA